jgi:hypothetical protein
LEFAPQDGSISDQGLAATLLQYSGAAGEADAAGGAKLASREASLDKSFASSYRGITSPDQEHTEDAGTESDQERSEYADITHSYQRNRQSSPTKNVPGRFVGDPNETPMRTSKFDHAVAVDGILINGASAPLSRPRSLYKVQTGSREGAPAVLLSDEHAFQRSNQKAAGHPLRQSASPAARDLESIIKMSESWVRGQPITTTASTTVSTTGDRVISGGPDMRAHSLDMYIPTGDHLPGVRSPLPTNAIAAYLPIGGPAGRLREHWNGSLDEEAHAANPRVVCVGDGPEATMTPIQVIGQLSSRSVHCTPRGILNLEHTASEVLEELPGGAHPSSQPGRDRTVLLQSSVTSFVRGSAPLYVDPLERPSRQRSLNSSTTSGIIVTY